MKKRILTALLFVMSITLGTVAFAASDTNKAKSLEDQIMKTLITTTGCHEVQRLKSLVVESSNAIMQKPEQSTGSYAKEGIQPFWTFCCDSSIANVVNYSASFVEHTIGTGSYCTATIYVERRCTYCDVLHSYNIAGEYTHLHE